jgi:glycosyltransferase involved in cell wall biosynthesis
MNIMQIASGSRISGAVTYCLGLTRELAARGHRVTLLCKAGAWIGQQVEALGIETLGIEVIHSDLCRWRWGELRRVANLARARDIDVLQTHVASAHNFGAALRLLFGIPCVATAQARRIQLHWRMHDYVIACSEATRRFHRFANLVPGSRIVTAPNFIEPAPYLSVTPAERAATRAALGIGTYVPLIGLVGKLSPRKGQIDLVRALPRILRDHPRAVAMFVGDANVHRDYLDEIEALSRQLSVERALVWTGTRRDIPRLLAACDVVTQPSLDEELPLAILEAMAAGKPVVATTVGGVPECIVPGVSGALIPPRRPHLLAEEVTRLLGDSGLRQRIGAAARARVLECFSSQAVVAKVEAVLQRAAASGQRSAA